MIELPALRAVITGDRNSPAVLLLHAIATHSQIWSLQQAVWGSRFYCIAFDLAGHGESPPLAGPQLSDYAAQVSATLRGLGVDRASVVGLSFGGMVAQSLALNHPEQVAALVLAQTSARTSAAVQTAWHARIQAVLTAGIESQLVPTLERWFSDSFRSSAPLTLAWIKRMILSTPPAGFVSAARAIVDLDHLDRLPDISVPTLVVAGKHDTAVPLEAAQSMVDRLARSRLLVLSGAHLTNIECAHEFTETVGEFLTDPSRGIP